MFIDFCDSVDDALLKYAVIVSVHEGKLVFCKHKERDTYEVPGGHRETNEDIIEAAKRELYEETGAVEYNLNPVCVYSVTDTNNGNGNNIATYGLLCFADIKRFEDIPEFEIERIELFEKIPDNLTYPLIQPKLIEKVKSVLSVS